MIISFYNYLVFDHYTKTVQLPGNGESQQPLQQGFNPTVPKQGKQRRSSGCPWFSPWLSSSTFSATRACPRASKKVKSIRPSTALSQLSLGKGFLHQWGGQVLNSDGGSSFCLSADVEKGHSSMSDHSLGICAVLDLIREQTGFSYLCKWICKIKCTALHPKPVLIQ